MKKSLLLGLLALGCSGATARADLSYTQTTTTAFGGMMGAAGGAVSKTSMKGGNMRIETNAMGSQSIILTNGAKTTQINPQAKIYSVSSGADAPPRSPMGPRKGMGPTEMTVSVKKLGVEKIRGINAPHWRIDMTMKMNTERGPQTMKVGTEVWSSTTPYPAMPGATSTLKKLPSNLLAMFSSNVKMKGDVKSLGSAYATVPLRMKIFMNGQQFGTTETTDISTRPLPASLFSVPAGYRLVSSTQFGQVQQQAMMRKMGGMFKGMPGMPGR